MSRYSVAINRRSGTIPDARHGSKRNVKPSEVNRHGRRPFFAMACIVIAAIFSAAFSNVLAQVGSGAGSSVSCGGSGNSAVVPCPEPVKQGPAGVSQAAALGSLSLTTSSNHSINASVRSHLFDLRAGARGLNLSGLSLDKAAGGALLGAVTSLATPPEWSGGASADSSSVLSKFGMFANWQGSFGDQDATSREPGFDFHTAGVSVGGDYRFTDRFISGLAFGYLRTNADFHSSAGDFTSDAYSLSAYGTYYILDKLYVDGVVTYGWNTYDTERNVANTGKAKGSTAGTHVAPSVNIGYNFNIGAFTFGPTGRAEYVRVDINAFREHGADPFNLSIRSQKIESVTTALGGRVTYAVSTPWGVLLPLVRSEWVHEYKGDSRRLVGSFTANPVPAGPTVSSTVFTVQTTSPSRDYCDLGAGLSATFKSGVSAFAYYEAILGRTHFTDNTFHAGVRVEF